LWSAAVVGFSGRHWVLRSCGRWRIQGFFILTALQRLANKIHQNTKIVDVQVIQTFLIFFAAYGACKALKLPHNIAAPAGMIGASNFFELAVAVAISLFGAKSPVALATIVGVLVEVSVMLTPPT